MYYQENNRIMCNTDIYRKNNDDLCLGFRDPHSKVTIIIELM